jgi:hypothetical protein
LPLPEAATVAIVPLPTTFRTTRRQVDPTSG